MEMLTNASWDIMLVHHLPMESLFGCRSELLRSTAQAGYVAVPEVERNEKY